MRIERVTGILATWITDGVCPGDHPGCIHEDVVEAGPDKSIKHLSKIAVQAQLIKADGEQ